MRGIFRKISARVSLALVFTVVISPEICASDQRDALSANSAATQPSATYAGQVYRRSVDSSEQSLLTNGSFKYLTLSGDISPTEALSGQWIENSAQKYVDPKVHEHYWFDFTFTHNGAESNDLVIFHRSNFTAEELTFYAVNGNSVELLGISGSNYPRDARTLKTRLLGARVLVSPGQTQRFLVHARSSRNFYPDFGFNTHESFGHFIQESNFLMGICIGVHLIAIFISSFFAWALRDKAYAWFSGLSLAMILTIVVGFGFRDIISNKMVAFDSAHLLTVLRPMVLLLFLQTATCFLDLKKNAAGLNTWMRATMISLMALTFIALIPGFGKYAIDGCDRLVFVGMLLSVIAAYRCYRANVSFSGYFLAATSTLILSTLPLMVTTITTRHFSYFEMNLIPVGQSIEMLILSMALIAKVRRIDEARLGAEAEASKSEQLKTLVRVMSHDLNNPLTVVISYARIGLKKAQGASLEDLVSIFNKILKASLNQSEIIEHIKLMRAIEDGKASLKLSGVSLLDALKQAESTFERKLIEKNLTLDYDPSQLSGCDVLADATSLNHNVLNNLLSNAIKFSHPGSKIQVSAESSDGRIRLVVKDHGVGMSPDLVKNVFRTDAPTSRAGTGGETGTGFGMPVVKTYMNRYGGEIYIESNTEAESPTAHGTKVTLEFKKAA